MNFTNANVSPFNTMIYKDFNDTKLIENVTKVRKFDTVSMGSVTTSVAEKKSKIFSKTVIARHNQANAEAIPEIASLRSQ